MQSSVIKNKIRVNPQLGPALSPLNISLKHALKLLFLLLNLTSCDEDMGCCSHDGHLEDQTPSPLATFSIIVPSKTHICDTHYYHRVDVFLCFDATIATLQAKIQPVRVELLPQRLLTIKLKHAQASFLPLCFFSPRCLCYFHCRP